MADTLECTRKRAVSCIAWGRSGVLRIGAAVLTSAVVVGKMSPLNKQITASLATEIDRRIRELPDQRTESIRHIRREFSAQLRGASASDVLALAQTLVERQRWVAYELLYLHPSGLTCLDIYGRLFEELIPIVDARLSK